MYSASSLLDDPLYLERYLRPPMLPYGQPALMGPPFYPGSRYDLLAHSLSLSNSSIINHERLKAEEQDRRLREKELELKEQERQRDRENREKEHRERRKDEQSEHRKSSSSYSSKRTESPSVRNNSSVPNNAPVTVVSNSSSTSIPLNLVLQSSAELPRKESTELWMPWQQPTAAKDANHEAKHPAFRTQDNQRHHQTNDKPTHRFSPPTLNDKKLPPVNDTMTNDRKQHLDLNNRTPVDSRTGAYQDYHQRALPEQPPHRSGNSHETSHKDSSVPHEWRHEKLQKACTNIHRKTHESKKKDGGLYPLGHRKNGAVFAQGTKSAAAAPPLLYQNEGMHARLVESEKCRLEMNGHAVKTTVVAPTPYKTSSVGHYTVQQHQSKEPCHNNNNKSFSDYFATHPKCSDLVPPVVSKLDLDLKRLRRGQRPTHDDEEMEEKRIRSLLVVARVPRMKLDTNPNKLNFLRMFGLTTHLKKKKVEFDMFLKRRKRLRLDTSSPLVPDEGTRLKNDPDDFDDLINANCLKIERLSERLRIEDCGPAKENFLAVVGLKPLSNEQKEAKDCQRRKVYDEKCRRHFRFLATVNRKSSPKRLFVPKSEAARRLYHLRKLNEMNALASLTTSAEEEEETKHTPAPKTEQVPYPSPVSKSNKFSFKRGHSLKREFRFAAPHTTKSKCERAPKNEVAPSAARCISTQVDAAELGVSELKSSLSSSATIEVLMSVILRNQTEQSGEKSVLSDRCQQLRQTHEDLKKQAEDLTKHMSDLLRSKRELDEERQRSQKSIDHLKKCLQVGR
ncbi:hypothetical protein JTE90_019389 [Oedothorax gibbosus]|uniref:Genetic suppressor element-like domain-containing protein n=1 Tax=Oedothorax gibbosus TaxID=931172 RepID=A0AAV6UAB6_9ARAC|nr:hypothetical protein JTE90_019389 [Oedothorax gibbosus]